MYKQFRKTAYWSRIVFVLLGGVMWAQNPFNHETEVDTINRVKNLPVSSLDHRLPRVTLEFLQYEGEGAPIKWSTEPCERQNSHGGPGSLVLGSASSIDRIVAGDTSLYHPLIRQQVKSKAQDSATRGWCTPQSLLGPGSRHCLWNHFLAFSKAH